MSDLYDGYTAALRGLGQEVHEYNLDRRLQFYSSALLELGERGPDGQVTIRRALGYDDAVSLALNGLLAACYRIWPDVLLIVSGLFVDERMLDCIRDRGTRVVILHTEEPYEHDRQLALAGHADLNLVNDPTHLDAFRAVAPTWYLPHAYQPDRHRPRSSVAELACDFAFVGTGYPSRVAFLERVDWSGLSVRLAGNWVALPEDSALRACLLDEPDACMDNDRAADLYASCSLSANLYRREANDPGFVAGWAMSPREVELAAMGRFFLRESRGEGDAVLPMLPTFAGPEDFGEQVRWWLARHEDRAEVAGKARLAVADRTFANHAEMLLRLLGA